MVTQTTQPQRNTAYRQCTKCVLDTIDDPHMSFDADGVCNYYHQYLKTAKKHLPAAAQRDHLLEQLGSDLLSITELTHQIMRVPVAALHICRQAGEAARKRDVDVLTLEQACSLLGTQRLINLLRELPVVEHDQLPRPYRQLLSISEHAGHD